MTLWLSRSWLIKIPYISYPSWAYWWKILCKCVHSSKEKWHTCLDNFLISWLRIILKRCISSWFLLLNRENIGHHCSISMLWNEIIGFEINLSMNFNSISSAAPKMSLRNSLYNKLNTKVVQKNWKLKWSCIITIIQ